ncbi:MAG: hypothetical protein ACI4II_03460 [Acutalibacteraceae bacterium]
MNCLEYAKVSITMVILICMIKYPMMKVDFQIIKNIGQSLIGLFVTWITNWLIKPFTMYGMVVFVLYDFKDKNKQSAQLSNDFVCALIICFKILCLLFQCA